MPASHAKLSPSASERWIECPASIRMEGKLPPERESFYAAEGTAAHALGEIKARHHFGLETDSEFEADRAEWEKEWTAKLELTHEQITEMERHTDAYVALIQERLDANPGAQLLLEQRLNTGVPTCWGTSDAVIVSLTVVEIIDFKYGQGVRVEAVKNPQLRLYGLGALRTFGDVLGDTETIRITVHQPRLDHVDTEVLDPDELRSWRDEVVIPAARLALGPDAPFGPSETACRWCPASGRCKAQLEAVFAEEDETQDVELLTPDEIASTLERIPAIREWLKAFEEAALTQAYSEGVHIPGYKVVRSGGQRSIADAEGAIKYLRSKGFGDEEILNTKVKGIGELEKLLGVKEFAEELAPFLRRSEGQPSIVPESDKREAIDPNGEAKKEFK